MTHRNEIGRAGGALATGGLAFELAKKWWVLLIRVCC